LKRKALSVGGKTLKIENGSRPESPDENRTFQSRGQQAPDPLDAISHIPPQPAAAAQLRAVFVLPTEKTEICWSSAVPWQRGQCAILDP